MNNNLTEIIFILDMSGSMTPLIEDTIGGFNSLIEKHKKSEGECKVTTVLFNDVSWKIHDCIDIKEIQPITRDQALTFGCTALLDTVGKTIDEVGVRLAATPEEERPCKVTVVITTDGEENASRKYTQEKIKEMIELQQNTYNWTFMFLGANINAEQVGSSYGITHGHSHTYTGSGRGVASVYSAVANSLDYIQMRSCTCDSSLSWTDADDKAIAACLSSVE